MLHRTLGLACVVFLTGCATVRTVTINTKPGDAMIRVDDIEAGRGPYVHEFVFRSPAEVHTVSAAKLGYKETSVTVTSDFNSAELVLELKPVTKTVNISVQPMAANVSVDGRPIDNEPVSSASKELEFTIDANKKWTTHTITADRPNFLPASVAVNYIDKDPNYVLVLKPVSKSVTVTTTPPGADVFVDFQKLGSSPVRDQVLEFPVDAATGNFKPRKLRAEKPGYDPVSVDISWDNGKADYQVDLLAKTKTVRFITDPPNANIKIDGSDLARDSSGAAAIILQFPPINDKGDLKTYSVAVSRKTADSEWEPQTVTLAWDNGRSEYQVALKEILTRPVKLLEAVMRRGDDGWEVEPQWTDTLGMKDTSEGPGRSPPQQMTRLARGTQIGSLVLSPDGLKLLFTVLATGATKNDFRSQMLSIRTDGSGGADIVSDGKSLDLMPTCTPGGDFILFTSNRAGKRLNVWRMSAIGAPGVTRLTPGDSNDLWPSVDSDPKPRLFYQAMVDARPEPHIYMTQLGTIFMTDLTNMSGMQPRVSPKNDYVLFVGSNAKNG